MPGGLHRHCCCEPPEPGPCGACPRFGESITAVVSGIEMCGCVEQPEVTPFISPLYAEVQLLSGSINGVHTLEWWPWAIDMCSWRSGPIARARTIYGYRPCSGPCYCLESGSDELDVFIRLDIRPDTFPPATWLKVQPGIFSYSASEIRCEGEYENRLLICGGDEGLPLFVGGTITLSR